MEGVSGRERVSRFLRVRAGVRPVIRAAETWTAPCVAMTPHRKKNRHRSKEARDLGFLASFHSKSRFGYRDFGLPFFACVIMPVMPLCANGAVALSSSASAPFSASVRPGQMMEQPAGKLQVGSNTIIFLLSLHIFYGLPTICKAFFKM